MSNYNCLTMMILRKCRANYEELTSLINSEVTKGILVNFLGTLLTREAIAEVEEYGYRYIMDGEWEDRSTSCTLKEWMEGEK